MADIILAKPQAGERVTIPSAADARLQFDFSTADTVLEKVGNDLVFTFSDGSSIVLTDFYTAYTKENMPEFVVEGQTIAGADFFAALGSDNLMPAAGPAAAAANGARYHSYDEASLMDGIDRLGGLDLSGEGAAQPVDTLAAASAFVPTVDGLGGNFADAGVPVGPGTPSLPDEPANPGIPPVPVEPPVDPVPPVDPPVDPEPPVDPPVDPEPPVDPPVDPEPPVDPPVDPEPPVDPPVDPEPPVDPPVDPEPPFNDTPTVEDSTARADYGDTSVSGKMEDFDAGADGFGSITVGGSTASRGEDGSWSFDDPTQGSVNEDGSLNFNAGGGTTVRLDPETGDYTISNPGGLQDSSVNISIKDGNGDKSEGTITVETPTVSGEQNSNANDVILKGEDSYNNDVIVSDTGGITTTIKGGDYNIAICLDISGSMSQSSGYDVNGDGTISGNPEHGKADCPDSLLDMALASLKSMVAGFEGHQGTINLAIFPFASYKEMPIYLKIDPNADFDTIMKNLTEQLDKVYRFAMNAADGGTNPQYAADAANEWLSKQGSGKDVVYILTDGKPGDGDTATDAFDRLKGQHPDADVNGIGFGDAAGEGMGWLNKWGSGKDGIFIKSPDELQGALEDGMPIESRVAAGSDLVVGGAGQDVIFGDTALEYNGLQGLSAVQKYIADQLGLDVSTMSPEIMYSYIKAHPGEFDQSHLTGTDGKGHTVEIDKADMLIGGSGHDIIYGQGGDDVLLGDGNSASAEQLAQKLGTHFDSSSDSLGGSVKGIADAIHSLDRSELSDMAAWTESHMENAKTDGNDTIFGGAGNDVLFGGAGDDKLFGGDGNDIIFGGSGNDYIDGGAGADKILVGSGNDLIVFDKNDTLIDGGDGFDVLLGGSADDLAAMKDGLFNGTITDVELLVSGKGSEAYAGLTSMDDLLSKLGIDNVNGKVDMGAAGFTGGSEIIGTNGETYLEFTNGNDLTVIVAKSALENSGV